MRTALLPKCTVTGEPGHVALFLATSGHSGVDRIMPLMMAEFLRRGIRVDLLHVRRHGPLLASVPEAVRVFDLGTRHVSTSLPALVHYLRRERPDALLCDKDRVNRVGLIGRCLAGTPTRVVVRMGTVVSASLRCHSLPNRWMRRLSLRVLYRMADAIVTPSRGAATDLANTIGVPVSHVTAIPNPLVGSHMFALADEPAGHRWLKRPEPVILGVGELSPRKDFATLMRAFAWVRSQRPCRLLILGDGRERSKLEALSRTLELRNDIDLLGFVPNPYAYMSRASVVALPSRWEGLGNVLVEALALGVPVVATDCPGGPREVLDDGRVGALAPVGDVQALAEALAATLDRRPDPALLRSAARPYHIASSATRYLQTLGLAARAICSKVP